MTTYDDINEIIHDTVAEWGNSGKRVIENAFSEHRKMNMNEFLDHCTACGGNWGGMLLSGMKEIYPKTYEAIPDDMGHHAFGLICNTLILCGVYITEK